MTNRCVSCGEEIPDGRQVCRRCEAGDIPVLLANKEVMLKCGLCQAAAGEIIKAYGVVRNNRKFISSRVIEQLMADGTVKAVRERYAKLKAQSYWSKVGRKW